MIPEHQTESDLVLRPFLQATESEADALLSNLLAEQAAPIIEGIVRSKLRASLRPEDGTEQNQDALDIINDVRATLIAELKSLRQNSSDRCINNFQGYVAAMTFHACYGYLRRKRPQRHSLKKRLRYVLSHHPNLAVWESSEGDWGCGLDAWKDRRPLRLMNLDEISSRLKSAIDNAQQMSLVDLVPTVLGKIGAPIVLDLLVSLIAELKEIGENTEQEVSGESKLDYISERLTDPRAGIAVELEHRSNLARLWQEIAGLPLRQRSALLLNLRDSEGRDVISLFPATGIASIKQIAETLAIPIERFVQMWNDLPMDDACIADRLGVTRQQVINLRKSARARLARRMREYI